MSLDPTTDALIADTAIRTRVKQIIETPEPTRSWAAHPLTSIIVGFIGTGLVGGLLSHCYQSKQEAVNRNAQLAETRRIAALTIMDTLGALMNRGYYIYYQYFDAIPASAPTDTASLTSRRARFAAFNEQLKSSRVIDAARVCAFMGHPVEAAYRKVMLTFQSLESDLAAHEQSLKFTPDSHKRDSLHRVDSLHLVTLQNRIYGVVLSMAAVVTDTGLYERAHCPKADST